MDDRTRALLMGAAGAAGEKTYVEDVFSTYLYTGNGSTQTITNDIDLAGEGGLVWLKNRNISYGENHALYDSERGIGSNLVYKDLSTDSTASQQDRSTNGVSAFNSDGFTVIGNNAQFNTSPNTYASWTFRKAPKFFDVVTWTGDGTNGRAISHALAASPRVIIVKRTDSSSDWAVYSPASLWTGESYTGLYLNTTAARGGTTANGQGISAISSTSFTVISSGSNPLEFNPNINGATYVAYLFAHDAGGFGDSGNENVISCGSYTGNGSTTGPVVTLGWEPQWLLIKNSSISADWILIDNMRGWPVGSTAAVLKPNTSDSESSAWMQADITPTGFQIRTTDQAVNGSGNTLIYIAIRRGPMKTPTDATEVFSSVTFNSDVFNGTKLQNACLTDWFFIANRNAGGFNTYDRLTPRSLVPSSSSAEGSVGYSFDLMDGVISTGTNYFATDLLRYHFRRAPGFFDVVAYNGTGSSSSLINHNLQAIPELVIIKNRTSTASWPVAVKINSTQYLWGFYLNSSSALTYGMFPFAFGNTDTQFAIGISSGTDIDTYRSGENYIAYLFASCPGVSKVGTYSGTGTTLDIDCGFTAGARFVLIRRVDTGGAWYVWDTARGIVSGNDPYLLLNSTAAEVTNTDYIDPLSSGFQISSTAPAAINANGATYIFLAIA